MKLILALGHIRFRFTNGYLSILLFLCLLAACTGGERLPTPAPTVSSPLIEKEITFTCDRDELYGILTLPTSTGPYPAIVIISGSGDPSTGVRDGASSRLHIDHAHAFVVDGFAVLRYDPPRVGRSTGDHRFESLDGRVEEAMAAVKYLQTRPDIRPDQIGLWANSQGSWV